MAPGRRYDPALGRFISADTVVPEPGNLQALNRFSYVLNNPLRYIDPTGHLTDDQIAEWLGYDVEDLKQNNPDLYRLLSAMHVMDAVSAYDQSGNLVGGLFCLEWYQTGTGETGYRSYIVSGDDSRTLARDWFGQHNARQIALWRRNPNGDWRAVYTEGQPRGYFGYSGQDSWTVQKHEELTDKAARAVVGILILVWLAKAGAKGRWAVFSFTAATFGTEPFLKEGDQVVWYWYPYQPGYNYWKELFVIRKGKVIPHEWKYANDRGFLLVDFTDADVINAGDIRYR